MMPNGSSIMSIPVNPTGPETIAILDRTTEERVGTVGGPITPGFDPIFKDSENGELSLDFFVPAASEDADKITKGNLALIRDPFIPAEWRLFEIDEIDFEKDSEGNAYKRAVCMDQMTVELDDDWIHTVDIQNKSALDALSLLLRTGESRWKVGNVSLTTTGSAKITKKTAAAGLSDLVATWGGILRSRVEVEGGQITGRYIDWYAESTWENFTGVRFENGKNLLGVKKTIVRRYVKTKVFPYGKKMDVNAVYWVMVQRTTSKSTAEATVADLIDADFPEAKVIEEESGSFVAVARIYKMKAWAGKEVYAVREAGWPGTTLEEKQLDGTGAIDSGATGEDGEYVTIKGVVKSREKGDLYEKPEDDEFIADPEALSIWGRPDPATGQPRHKVEQVDFPEIEDPEELYEAGAAWLQEHNHELATFEAEILDRSMEPGRSHESIRLGTAGYVIDDDFSPSIEVRARVVAVEVNLNDRSDVRVTLGNFAPSQIAASNAVEAELKKKVDQGAPITLLDTTIQTSRDDFNSRVGYKMESSALGTVWSNGVYGDPETNGYVGIKGGKIMVAEEWDPVADAPAYRTAIDGKGISADMITTGTLNAALVNIESGNDDGDVVRMRDGYIWTYQEDEATLALGGRGLWLYSPVGWQDPTLGHNYLAKMTNGWFYKSGDTEPSLIGLSLSTFRDVASINHVLRNADGSTSIDKAGLHLNWTEKYAGLYFNKLYLGESGIAHLDTSPYTGGDTGADQAAMRVKADSELYMFMSRKKVGGAYFGQYHFRMPYYINGAWTDGPVMVLSLAKTTAGGATQGAILKVRDPATGNYTYLVGSSSIDPS